MKAFIVTRVGDTALLVGLLGTAAFATLAAILLKSRLAAIAALGVVGYCVALVYILFGAPEVAPRARGVDEDDKL